MQPIAPARRRLRWQRLEWAALALAIFALVLWFSGPGHFARTNAAVQDIATGLNQPVASSEIVIIAIDDASIAAIGRWPWRRALHAQLLQQLSRQPPLAIGMDILFNEEDLDYPGDDLMLARAIAQSARVVLPVVRSNPGARNPADLPLAALAQGAGALGHVHVQVDGDGVARSYYAYQGPAQQPWPHLALAMHCMVEPTARACAPPAAASTAAASTAAASNASGSDAGWQRQQREIIRYAKPQPAFTRYAYIDVLRGAIPAAAFRDKYVLIGATATGLGPGFSPPSGTGLRQLPNVDMLAHVLNDTLQHRPLQAATPWANRLFNAFPVLLALVGLAVLGPSSALAVCAGLLGLTLLAAALAPMAFGVQFAPAAALVALAFIYPLWSWRRLNAAAHFLGLEMQDLQKGLPMMQPAPQTGGDFLARRISAVEHASRELRRLHHFVSESLLQLPSATFVCDDQGRVLLANTLAQQYAASVGQGAVTGLALPTMLQGLRDRDSGAALLTHESLRSADAPLHLEGEDRQGRSLMLLRKPLATGTTSGWIITLVDLSAMRQALAQRDQAMHFISHDIRAPIGAIITLLDMRDASAGPPSAELLQRIERYAQSSLTLADDFVHLARAQNQPLRQEAVDLAWVLEQAIDDCWAQAQAQGMELSFLPPEEAAMLQGDASLLRRAIVNLIGNAIKYGRPAQPAAGGARIECALVARGNAWALSVRDHGPGIPADQQGRLFQAFDRLQNQNNTQTKGVGLGLAFVHTVVTRHGGQIEVSSGEGMGSVFTLVLPKLPEDSATTM